MGRSEVSKSSPFRSSSSTTGSTLDVLYMFNPGQPSPPHSPPTVRLPHRVSFGSRLFFPVLRFYNAPRFVSGNSRSKESGESVPKEDSVTLATSTTVPFIERNLSTGTDTNLRFNLHPVDLRPSGGERGRWVSVTGPLSLHYLNCSPVLVIYPSSILFRPGTR